MQTVYKVVPCGGQEEPQAVRQGTLLGPAQHSGEWKPLHCTASTHQKVKHTPNTKKPLLNNALCPAHQKVMHTPDTPTLC